MLVFEVLRWTPAGTFSLVIYADSGDLHGHYRSLLRSPKSGDAVFAFSKV